MARPFYILDVFTHRALAGNPLAVVLDAEGLETARMQAIAREFNLSETVFVLPPRDPVNSARLRIFTPTRELPFAGHPSVGAAALLAELRAGEHLKRGIVIALEEEVGLIHAEVRRTSAGVLRAVFDLPRLPEALPHALEPQAVAEALGLDVLDLGFGAHGLSLWSAGLPFAMVPLRDRAALARARVGDMVHWRAAFEQASAGNAFLYTRETQDPAHHVCARMFWPTAGMVEDPATGGAVAAFAGVAATLERPEDGEHALIIEQGFDMGRPSLISLDLDIRGGLLVRAALGGASVRVAEGTLHV